MSNNHPKISTRPRRRRRILAAAALAASATMLAGQTTTASAGPIKRGDDGKSDGGIATSATFSNPNDESGKERMFNHLEKLIDKTPKGATISVAEFRLQDKDITGALEKAADKGVHVQVVVSYSAVHGKEGSERDNARELKDALNKDSDKSTWMKVCGEVSPGGNPESDGKACFGTNEMHSKFFLFSKSSGSSAVTAIGTANMNADTLGGTGGWNSFYTDVGNKALHRQYTKYFTDLAQSAAKGDSDGDYYQTNPPKITGDVKSYFYPRDKGDTVVNTLKTVNCTFGSKIRIGTWSFSRAPIAKELRRLASKGCSVEIVTNKFQPEVCNELFKGKKPKGIKVRGFSEAAGTSGIHTKDMMIDEVGLGGRDQTVFTGSMNLNKTSLHLNDETAIRIRNNERIYAEYVDNFQKMQKDANINAASEKSCNKIGH